ncbi:metabotropic glutamate receptor 2-like [Oratosquilla oratoria]|uniref:metabotropic glutamate receptor 2-like n=1 Tax=Oratosquilla oratoria TaxID=337810 RepID=UPI003F75B434
MARGVSWLALLLLGASLGSGRRVERAISERGCGNDGTHLTLGGDAVLTALLPLHHGTNCHKVSLEAVHVLEALRMAATQINENHFIPGVRLGLQVLDTCSNPRRSVKMALSSLVAAGYASCDSKPLLLGFLGPGDADSAQAVGRATRALRMPVVSYSPHPADLANVVRLYNPIGDNQVKAAVRAIEILGLTAVSVVHTDDPEGRALASLFSTAASESYVCMSLVYEAPKTGSLNALQNTLRDEGDGVVVILGTTEGAARLAKELGKASGAAEFLIMVDNAGPVPSSLLAQVTAPTLVLRREVVPMPEYDAFLTRDLGPQTDLRREYLAAVFECDADECHNVEVDSEAVLSQDNSVPSTVSAVLLYAKALQNAHKRYCGDIYGVCGPLKLISATEWLNEMGNASLVVGDELFPSLKGTVVAQNQDMSPAFTLTHWDRGNWTKVGKINGDVTDLAYVKLPSMRCSYQCGCQGTDETYSSDSSSSSSTTTTTTTTTTLPPTQPPTTTFTFPHGGDSTPFEKVVPPGNIVRTTTTQDSGDYGYGWNWSVPDFDDYSFDPQRMSKTEFILFMTGFTIVALLVFITMLTCLYKLQRPPPRS